jgi:predicted nucleic acid-binding protein
LIIVADASPLISLAIINKLHLLDEIFEEIIVPFSVYTEIIKTDKKFSSYLQEWSKPLIKKCKNIQAFNAYQISLGKGESEAIVLSKEFQNSILLVDDKKARTVAKLENHKVIGTVGILLLAKERALVSEIKSLLIQLEENYIHLSKSLIEKALSISDELSDDV